MNFPHLFEFMDQTWLPSSLRATLREILEGGNSRPFRSYYRWVADEVLRAANNGGFTEIVELGAGTAPITRLLAERALPDHVRLIPCDVNPDGASYRALEVRYPVRVFPKYMPVDFSEPRYWGPEALLFLSATFHHIPPAARAGVIAALTASSRRVMIFEPLRRNLLSILFVPLSIVPAMLLPLWFIGRPGRLRRFLWCWAVPLAPLMFWWDGIVSCLRQWTGEEWKTEMQRLSMERVLIIKTSFVNQMVAW